MTLRGTLTRTFSRGIKKLADLNDEGKLGDAINIALNVAKRENITKLRDINTMMRTDPRLALIELEKLFPGSQRWVQEYINDLRKKDPRWSTYSLDIQKEKADDMLYGAVSKRLMSLVTANQILKTDSQMEAEKQAKAQTLKNRAQEEWLKEKSKRATILNQGVFDKVGGGRKRSKRRTSGKKSKRINKRSSRKRSKRTQSKRKRTRTRQSKRSRRRH